MWWETKIYEFAIIWGLFLIAVGLGIAFIVGIIQIAKDVFRKKAGS